MKLGEVHTSVSAKSLGFFEHSISYLLLYNKVLQNLVVSSNNKYLLSHSFYGLGNQKWLNWVDLA